MIRIPRHPPVIANPTPQFFGKARLDNVRDLRTRLRLDPGMATSTGDLILAAWQQWGSATPASLLGDFSFVIVHPARREIFGARDPFGVLPFYFALSEEALTFSLTVAGVLSAGQLSPTLDDAFVAASLRRPGFTHAERTWLNGINKLPGGYRLHIDDTTVRTDAYWSPMDVPEVRLRRDEDYVDAARSLFITAVEDRLGAGDPVGAHLSGGLDSTAVAVLAARACRHAGRAAPIISAWQPGPGPSTSRRWEHALVESACEHEHLAPHFDAASVDDVVELALVDPVQHATTVDLVHEAATVRAATVRGVRRILSGWGGDEGLSSSASGAAAEMLREGRWLDCWTYCRRASINPIHLAASEGRQWLRPIAGPTPRSYLAPTWMARADELDGLPYERRGPRGRALWAWHTGQLASRMEAWHAYGGRHGVEYVYPMLDRRVVEFALGIPLEQHRRGGTGRWLMRRVARGILPEDVRVHADKSDPERSRSLIDTVRAGLAQLARTTDVTDMADERLAYLDRTAFLADFTPAGAARSSSPGLFWRTVGFVMGR